jgi:DNA polymerase I-like protein with 3'-5' exonuclease and polymerase domains/5'-3' exonuclease
MRLILDANAVLNPALLGGTDHDQGRVVTDDTGKQIQVNSAQYGVDNFFDRYREVLEHFGVAPRDTILVWDGAGAKARRRTFLPTYKQGRDKHPAVSEQLNIARERVTEMTLKLGAHVAQQSGLEGDDVIGYLCRHLRTQRNVVVTGDGDLSVLVDDNTDVWRGGELNRNPYGGFPHKYITLYKALVGDTSDKIPGAKGFGDKAWLDLVRVFGLDGLQEMQDMIVEGRLHELKESVADLKRLQTILDNKDMVTTSWRVASLMVDEVNTLHRPLDIRAGMVAQWNALDDSMRVQELKHFYGTKTLVTAANYEKARDAVTRRMAESPFVALDIETSSSEESDEWIERLNTISEKTRGDKIDVLGHELTGMSLTFGDNSQHTIYMSVDHADTDNITVDQCREMVEVIPQSKHIIIQNRQFEFSVLYRTWADKWMNNGWHGFVPNALDTKIGASYVDENLPKGLKQRSKHHLGYEQQTYEQVTTLSGPAGTLRGGALRKEYIKEVRPAEYRTDVDESGNDVSVEVAPAVTAPYEDRQYKMRELTAARVFDYGCDDTICTAALHTHYQLVMEMEGTWQVYLDVETLPEYLTTLAFVQGFEISLEKLVGMEKKDDANYDKAWATFREFLMKRGWSGTTCPSFDELTPAAVKEAASILVDTDVVQFSTKKRKLNGMAMDLREQFPDSAAAETLATALDRNDLQAVNAMVKAGFTGEPKINFGSPKQMQDLLYSHLGVRPRLLNRMTEKQKAENPVMADAFKKRRRAKDAGIDLFSLAEPVKAGRTTVEPLTPEEYTALISKASTDDDAVMLSLAKDDLTDEARTILKALQTIKTIQTRRSLFYKTYRVIPHWRDGRVHPSLNQAEAVTRRYSSSTPNVQQMPKRDEGKEFREIVLPHHADAVVASEDFNGQELRLMGEQSGDENLTACYVGENLLDVHSLTAAAAAIYLWGESVEYGPFQEMRESKDPVVKGKAKALRDAAKTVNFATQYDAQAENLSVQLMIDEETAQKFIDAKAAAFPRIDPWKDEVRGFAEKTGYVTTMLGARRHLRNALLSDNRAEAAKAGRQGPNFKIQGSGAEMAKLAMASMWRRGIFTGKYDARFIAPIHDEVVFSAGRGDAAEVIREVHECMTQPYADMKIPIVSSISLGRNFGEQIDCGDAFDAAAIAEALEEALA